MPQGQQQQQAQNDNHSNQLNPNNAEYKGTHANAHNPNQGNAQPACNKGCDKK